MPSSAPNLLGFGTLIFVYLIAGRAVPIGPNQIVVGR
jgi:hypothetical protein